MCKCISSRTVAQELKDCKTCSLYSVSQLYKKDIKYSDTGLFKCKLKCCRSCMFCERAITKERCKSRHCTNLQREIKICEKCFLCRWTVFCETCTKCPNCCFKSACGGKTSKLLSNLAGSSVRSKNSSNPERGLHPPLSDPAKLGKTSHYHKLLCQSSQEQLPVGGITSAKGQNCSRVGKQSKVPRVFQPPIFGAQTQQQVETNSRAI